jgi:hypothetical protein
MTLNKLLSEVVEVLEIILSSILSAECREGISKRQN